MPFTPFHCGPGLAAKGIFRSWFSFTIFTGIQILIDLESIYNIYFENYPIHAFFHSYAGVSLIAVVGCCFGVCLFKPFSRVWNAIPGIDKKGILYVGSEIKLKVVLISSFAGAYSHVFLDSIMHSDIRPFVPFSSVNIMYDVIGLSLLHFLCIGFGILGLIIIYLSELHRGG